MCARSDFRSGRSRASASASSRSARGARILPSSPPRRKSRSMKRGAASTLRSALAASPTGRCGSMCRLSSARSSMRASATDAVNAACADIEAMSDLHASAAYRRRVAVTLGIRALEQARDNAAASPGKGRAMKVELAHQRPKPFRRCRAAQDAARRTCARISCSTAPMPAASTASAAPARCCSTASRCAPA